jgi:hypothetical protein
MISALICFSGKNAYQQVPPKNDRARCIGKNLFSLIVIACRVCAGACAFLFGLVQTEFSLDMVKFISVLDIANMQMFLFAEGFSLGLAIT